MSPTVFRVLVLVWIAVAIATFAVLLRVRAPYGRHTRAGWGPTIGHRLGWFTMELPALLILPILALVGPNPKNPTLWVFVALWLVHYVHRTLIFPLRIPDTGKRMPIAIVLSAIFFNAVNGWMNGYYFGFLGPAYSESWLVDWRFSSGAALFVAGFVINLHSDTVLLRLRRSGRYEMPQDGLFRFVSCPNYLGEIIEWTGFAVMTWSPAAAAFALWTTANLVPRALSNHRWYKERFEDYPATRAALIPGLL